MLVTVTSNKSGRHVTLQITVLNKDGQIVPWKRAEAVTYADFDGELVVVYQPTTGHMDINPLAAGRAVWTVGALLRYFAGEFPALPHLATIDVANPDDAASIAA